jgi:hypothetical protein
MPADSSLTPDTNGAGATREAAIAPIVEASADAFLAVLQTRMDKCTNEQFWAVATISALNAASITNANDFAAVPKWIVAIALSAGAFYALYFVIDRHRAYYDFRKDFSVIAERSPAAPPFMREVRSAWELARMSGLLFYSFAILGGYALAMFLLLR